uniref:Uncharacterized protein n=1 Tax=Anguilla anguilla TaxID=7936 RepID=A0A0E9R9P3_ANGAN
MSGWWLTVLNAADRSKVRVRVWTEERDVGVGGIIG